MALKPNSNGSIVASFILGSAFTFCYHMYFTEKRCSDQKKNSDSKHDKQAKKIIIPPELREEQLSRNELYFGPDGMKKIKGSSILVVGLGGVGSHTAHMLARAGVGFLRIVDFDQVTLSSLNRHACATLEDVGISKVECIKRFIYKISGEHCEVDARTQMFTGDEETDGNLMICPSKNGSNWDVVIDAIDDVPTKANLIAHCVKNKIRVISCMSAGGKSDMTRLQVSDLRTASRDPLASKLRQTLKRKLKNDAKDFSCLENVDQVAVIYSSEKVVVKLADFTEEQKKEGVQKFGAIDNMRIRVIPVQGTMPAIMGQSLAGMALCELGGKPFTPLGSERLGKNVRHKIFQRFKNRELGLKKRLENGNESSNKVGSSLNIAKSHISGRIPWIGPVQIDADDVEYIFSEVWRNRCCVSGKTLGTVLELVRWDLSKPSNCQNIVLMGIKAIQTFDEAAEKTGDGRNFIPNNTRRLIEARLSTCKIDSRA